LFMCQKIRYCLRNTPAQKQASFTMQSKEEKQADYTHVFQTVLLQLADSTVHGRWYIINHDDDTDTNTLASFLHLTYTQLIAYLTYIGVVQQTNGA